MLIVLLNKPMLSRMLPRSSGGNHAPDQVVHAVGFPGSFLDALAGAGAHVQPNQPGIHGREEIAPQDEDKGHRSHAEEQKRTTNIQA